MNQVRIPSLSSDFLINESAKREREECTQLLAMWFDRRKLCRTPQAARSLAEQILAGNLEALPDV